MKLIPYESQHTRQLRYDIVALSQTLAVIEDDIADFHQAQYAFERQYQQRLGDLAEALMVLRAQLGLIESTSSVPPVLTQLADAAFQKLKSAYRQAAKLCHPDHLLPQYHEIGLSLFDTLNKAYHLQDLTQVEHILWLLQTGQAFSKQPIVITQKIFLEKRKFLLEQMLIQQQDYLAQLKMREDYDIGNRDNWNILLYDYQTQLEDELAMLRGRASTMTR